MRELTYFVAVSVDGYICAPDGSFDGFPHAEDTGASHFAEYPELVPAHVREQHGLELGPNRHFDTMVQGYGSYRVALDEGVTRPYAHMREYVLSTSRTSPDPAVRFISGDPLAAIRELKEEEGELGICLVGGAKAAAALLPEIDALLVKRYPVLLGAGKPLFDGAGYAPARFEPVSRHVFDSGADYTLYRRAWPSGGPFPSR